MLGFLTHTKVPQDKNPRDFWWKLGTRIPRRYHRKALSSCRPVRPIARGTRHLYQISLIIPQMLALVKYNFNNFWLLFSWITYLTL